ncbi:hypothetical protein FA10DRAFT_257509 [Acaromyces ingoldii]|uniref:PQ-loop-domain-containing protein n=1 Tax=Acaromyces ingoldii TaxID=215250 RepID=A0A316YWV7_9BASI|nr:hypothetical protein FA10DRAFT_257509 [Acaromyces ingoldii]PWN93158.1 hypothetical protein FA10DRAFT_257509 [Acaromyces ingoldii]
MDWQAVSDLAGTTSFVVWLFAQSPQIYENYVRSSVDGLSLVFVAQWCAGDLTNLVGCLLTHQLPFQVAVASYFCFIDIVILLQYYYYWSKNRAKPTEVAVAPVIQYGTFGTSRRYGSTSRPRYGSKSSSYSTLPRLRSTTASRPTSPAHTRRPPSTPSRASVRHHFDVLSGYEELSRAARSVASLAKKMAERSSSASSTRRRDGGVSSPKRGMSSMMTKTGATEEARKQEQPREHHDASSDDEGAGGKAASRAAAYNQMSDSIMSTASTDDGYGYGFGSASTHDLASAAAASGKTVGGTSPIPEDDAASSLGRGRDMTRTAGRILEASTSKTPPNAESSSADGGGQAQPMATATAAANDPTLAEQPKRRGLLGRFIKRTRNSASTSPTARKRTGIVFLGIWALFALRRPTQQPESSTAAPYSLGRVLHGDEAQAPLHWDQATHVHFLSRPIPQHPVTLFYHQVARKPGHGRGDDERNKGDNTKHRHRSSDRPGPPPAPGGGPSDLPPSPSWERILGRISAWICTVLYMTSRLPQIWENHVRKSVQGLSILLFIAAALGNFFYSVSVLVNPMALEGSPEAKREYLRESLPFLLGSGGTLVFDAVIVGQWVAWRGLQPLGEEIDEADEVQEQVSPPGQTQQGEEASFVAARESASSLERRPLLPSSH